MLVGTNCLRRVTTASSAGTACRNSHSPSMGFTELRHIRNSSTNRRPESVTARGSLSLESSRPHAWPSHRVRSTEGGSRSRSNSRTLPSLTAPNTRPLHRSLCVAPLHDATADLCVLPSVRSQARNHCSTSANSASARSEPVSALTSRTSLHPGPHQNCCQRNPMFDFPHVPPAQALATLYTRP